MAKCDLSIELDDPKAVHPGGGTICGVVRVNVDADVKCNGLEVFWDTPYHAAQPEGVVWDTNLDQAGALAWVEETFSSKPGFSKREDAGGDCL